MCYKITTLLITRSYWFRTCSLKSGEHLTCDQGDLETFSTWKILSQKLLLFKQTSTLYVYGEPLVNTSWLRQRCIFIDSSVYLCWTGSRQSSTFGRRIRVSSRVCATCMGLSLSCIAFLRSWMFFSISKISWSTYQYSHHNVRYRIPLHSAIMSILTEIDSCHDYICSPRKHYLNLYIPGCYWLAAFKQISLYESKYVICQSIPSV